jgi:enoyl-CoA hydratase/carnithine racemase
VIIEAPRVPLPDEMHHKKRCGDARWQQVEVHITLPQLKAGRAMDNRISITIERGVADVRLIRADKMNALDGAMFDALLAAGDQLANDSSIRAIVLSGEGRAFCAGMDVATLEGGGKDIDLLPAKRFPNGANAPQQVAMQWRDLPVPVIAAVHGIAFGGGLQIALGADMRFVTPDTRMSFMEIKWGIVPDMGGLPLTRRLMREDLARDLIYSGRIVDGREALSIGLATRLCDDPREAALAEAAAIAEKSPSAIRAAKRLLNLAADASDAELLMAESEEQAKLLGGTDQQEAMARALTKR